MWGFELHAPPSRQELDPAAAVATTSRTEEINKKKEYGPPERTTPRSHLRSLELSVRITAWPVWHAPPP